MERGSSPLKRFFSIPTSHVNPFRVDLFLILYCTCSILSSAEANQESMKKFEALNNSQWREVLNDPGTKNWKDQWTLDGTKATITHDEHGMSFTAGPEVFNDAHHAVMWTKKDFEGDEDSSNN